MHSNQSPDGPVAYISARDTARGHEVTLATRDNLVKTRDVQPAPFSQVSISGFCLSHLSSETTEQRSCPSISSTAYKYKKHEACWTPAAMRYFIREHEGVRLCQQYVPHISCCICPDHEDPCSHSACFLPGSLPPSTAWLSISCLLTPLQCQTAQIATSQFNLEWPLAFCTTCLFCVEQERSS